MLVFNQSRKDTNHMEVDALEGIGNIEDISEQGPSGEVGSHVNQINKSVSKSGYIKFSVCL